MQITEPVTMFTDYVLAAASLAFAILLSRRVNPSNRMTVRFWSLAFGAGAIAAFTGGTYHGLALDLDAAALRHLWNVTVFLIGACGAFVTAGILSAPIRLDSRKWIIAGILVTLAGFAIQQTGFRSHRDFNHNDIYHVIQTGALYCFFRGARLMQDRVRA